MRGGGGVAKVIGGGRNVLVERQKGRSKMGV